MSIDLKQSARQKSRVLFTGEWGDAWLQGSRTYYAEELSQRHWHSLYECFRTDTKVAGARQATKWFARHGVFPLLPHALQQGMRHTVRKIRSKETSADLFWLSPSARATLELRRKQFRSQKNIPVRSIGQRELLDLLNSAFTFQVLERLERQGARSGLEMRHPLGDHRIVQFAFSTPERLRLRGDRTKYLHVQAMQGLMPKTILERKTKAEFSVVFRSHLDTMKEMLTRTLPREHPNWVKQEGMERLYRFYQDKPQFGWPLWILWSLHGSDRVFKKSV